MTDNQNLLALTAAHWIIKHAELKLNLPFNDSHTSINLCSFLRDIFQKWNTQNKIASILADKAANIVVDVRHAGW